MRIKAIARRRVPGKMNRTEAKYAERLGAIKLAGEIASFEFENVTLKLAKDTRYTPDFMVLMPDGTIEFHEVKGFMRDDAWAKLKFAAERFPMFTFRLVKWVAKNWEIKEIVP